MAALFVYCTGVIIPPLGKAHLQNQLLMGWFLFGESLSLILFLAPQQKLWGIAFEQLSTGKQGIGLSGKRAGKESGHMTFKVVFGAKSYQDAISRKKLAVEVPLNDMKLASS